MSMFTKGFIIVGILMTILRIAAYYNQPRVDAQLRVMVHNAMIDAMNKNK